MPIYYVRRALLILNHLAHAGNSQKPHFREKFWQRIVDWEPHYIHDCTIWIHNIQGPPVVLIVCRKEMKVIWKHVVLLFFEVHHYWQFSAWLNLLIMEYETSKTAVVQNPSYHLNAGRHTMVIFVSFLFIKALWFCFAE